jgi:hypothetical protein
VLNFGFDFGFGLGFKGGLGVNSRGCFRLDRVRLRPRLSVRNGQGFQRSCPGEGLGSAMLGSGLGSGLLGVALVSRGRRVRVLVAIVAAQFADHVVFQRAGVRLLISDAEFGELLQYFVSFDFQLPRQLVNSDLSHR